MKKALALDRTKKQWVDLGIQTENCMTQPETCGEAGGAISVWMKLNDHGTRYYGLISTCIYGHSGPVFYTNSAYFWYVCLLLCSIVFVPGNLTTIIILDILSTRIV